MLGPLTCAASAHTHEYDNVLFKVGTLLNVAEKKLWTNILFSAKLIIFLLKFHSTVVETKTM